MTGAIVVLDGMMAKPGEFHAAQLPKCFEWAVSFFTYCITFSFPIVLPCGSSFEYGDGLFGRFEALS